MYRNNDLNALRALSHNKVPDALQRTNAFIPANEADDAGKRLAMPTPELLADRPEG